MSPAYLVALGARLAAAAAAAAGLGALARDVAALTAAVAGLSLLRALGAVTAYRDVSRRTWASRMIRRPGGGFDNSLMWPSAVGDE